MIVLVIRIARLPETLAFLTGLAPEQKVILGLVLVLAWTESLKSKHDAKKKKKS